MSRIALGVEYVGAKYSGWQSQVNNPEIRSVQAELERAISLVADHQVNTTCAGRTDAGVHACGQVVHCDINVSRDPYAWVHGCNRYLPRDIRVLWMRDVPDNFCARRSASHRHYKYVVYNNAIRPSLLNDYVGWYYPPVKTERILAAADFWVGEHDFSSFRGAGCQSKTPVREVKMITIESRGDMIIIDIIANAFLYHMVRNMVGVLLDIGSGRRPIEWAKQVLDARCRTKGGITAPPQGLYLNAVSYPEHLGIPEQHSGLWFFNQGLAI